MTPRPRSDPWPGPLPDRGPDLSPPARAGRLAARLRGRCLRSGRVEAALQEIGRLDSGALAALPRLSADVLEVQQAERPADPLRFFVPRQKPRWPLRRVAAAQAPPLLSAGEWKRWQAEVEETSRRLTGQYAQLGVLQARQTQLQADLQADVLTLRLASELLERDETLSSLWRLDLTAALEARTTDLATALTVTGQLGAATGLLLGNHRLIAGRLEVAARLLLYAAQTGLSLQQALAEQAALGQLPDPQLPDLLP